MNVIHSDCARYFLMMNTGVLISP